MPKDVWKKLPSKIIKLTLERPEFWIANDLAALVQDGGGDGGF